MLTFSALLGGRFPVLASPASTGQYWAVLGQYWAVLGQYWAVLGPVVAQYWGPLARTGPVLARGWPVLAVLASTAYLFCFSLAGMTKRIQ